MAYHEDVANDELTDLIINRAIAIHRQLGPGLPEELYQELLHDELCDAGVDCQREYEVELDYKGRTVQIGRADLYVDGGVVLELKAVKQVTRAHFNQLGRYVRACGATRGLLLNFGGTRVAIRRYTNFDIIEDDTPSR